METLNSKSEESSNMLIPPRLLKEMELEIIEYGKRIADSSGREVAYRFPEPRLQWLLE